MLLFVRHSVDRIIVRLLVSLTYEGSMAVSSRARKCAILLSPLGGRTDLRVLTTSPL